MNESLLADLDLPLMRPLSRLSSIFSLRRGIYSTIERERERLRLLPKASNEKRQIFFLHPNRDYEQQVAHIEGIIPYQSQPESENLNIQSWIGSPHQIRIDITKIEKQYSRIIFASDMNVFSLLDEIGSQIENDLPIWKKHNSTSSFTANRNFGLIGPRKHLHLHKKASVLSGTILDTRLGPIVLDAGVEVSPFSHLCGPLYAAPGARFDHAYVHGGCIVGQETRLGGEIENSIIGNFTNKHHEGFLGHSIVGNWVNLGALTTTSDLKNNYGEVRLVIPKNFHPNQEKINKDSKRIKFGAIIGDCVKTAIGTLLKTGTVIDIGSNIFDGSPPKYVPPFSWGIDGKLYEVSRFINDVQKIANRREQTFCEKSIKLIENLYCHRKEFQMF